MSATSKGKAGLSPGSTKVPLYNTLELLVAISQRRQDLMLCLFIFPEQGHFFSEFAFCPDFMSTTDGLKLIPYPF